MKQLSASARVEAGTELRVNMAPLIASPEEQPQWVPCTALLASWSDDVYIATEHGSPLYVRRHWLRLP
jgi:hypothetical protein